MHQHVMRQKVYQDLESQLPFSIVRFLQLKNIVIIQNNTYHNVIWCSINNTKPCFDNTILIVQQRNEEVILCSINIVILSATWLIKKCLQILIFFRYCHHQYFQIKIQLYFLHIQVVAAAVCNGVPKVYTRTKVVVLPILLVSVVILPVSVIVSLEMTTNNSRNQRNRKQYYYRRACRRRRSKS